MFANLSLTLSRVFFVLFALSGIMSGFTAQADQIDDNYDVARYETIYQDSVGRLNQARALLDRLNARVQQTAARLDREVRELDQLAKQIEANNAVINNSNARVQQLEQSIRTARAEIAQLQREIPETQRALDEEQRRNQQLANQVAPADQEAKRLEGAAKEKSDDARVLAQSAATKRQALETARSEYASASVKLAKLEQEKAETQKQLDSLQARANQLANQLESAKKNIEALERSTAQEKAKYDDAEAKALEAEKLADEADRANAPDARGKRARARAMRSQAERAKRDYDIAAQNLEAARQQVTKLSAELDRVNARKAELQNKAGEQDQLIASARAEVAPYKQKVDAAEREHNEAQSLAKIAAGDARNAQAAADQARAKANELQSRFQASEKRLADLRQDVTSRQNRLTALTRAVANWDREQDTERQNAVAADQRNRQLGPRVAQQRRETQNAENEFRQASTDRDQSAAIVANEERQVQLSLARLEQVRENLRRGIADASDAGGSDGGSDGSVEGERVAQLNADTQGREIGERDGRLQGTREGINRARERGRAEGTELGRTEGNEAGDKAGREAGEREGRDQGNTAGLEEGYNLGKDEGYQESYPKGEAAGHQMGGFQKGRTEGYAQGRARAEAQGKADGETEGKREANDKYLNAQLHNVIIPNRVTETAQSASFDRPNFENYRPRRNFPQHPAMQRAYLEGYRTSFYNSAAARYDAVFPGLYEQIRSSVFEATRQDFANRDYPAERQRAFDEARDRAYQETYKLAEKKAYDDVFQPTYDEARQAALPVRHDEGRAVGLKQGFDEGKANAYNADLAQGRSEGDSAGFDENYSRVKQASKDRAFAEVEAYYRSNAVLRFEGTILADANTDGIFAPGESFSLMVTMSNFGVVAQNRKLSVSLSEATPGLVVEQGNVDLVGIPGQTRAAISDVAALRVSPNAAIDSTQSVVATVSYDGKVLDQSRLTIKVAFPYSVARVDKPSYPTPGQDNPVKVTIANVSSERSASNVTVRLESLDGLAQITAGTADLGKISAGTSVTKELAFSFAEENANKTLSFEVQVYEGNWLLGKTRFTTDTAKRWAYNPAAAGLVLIDSSDLAKRSEAAARALGLGYDLWDVRVEGQLTEDAAFKYIDKALVIPSVNGSYDAATATAVMHFLARSGQALVGMGQGAHRTAVGDVIESYAKELTSRSMYGNLAVSAANNFRANEPKALIVEMRDARGLEVRALSELVNGFNAVRRTMTDKIAVYLAASAAGDQAAIDVARDALVFELSKEMRDNKAVKGNNYKKNKAALKLTAYINTALSKQGADRKALLQLYPSLEQARHKVEEDHWYTREPIRGVLEPLKKAYEKEVLGRKGS